MFWMFQLNLLMIAIFSFNLFQMSYATSGIIFNLLKADSIW